MKTTVMTFLSLVFIELIAGCSKPDSAKIFRSPDSPVYFSVETYYGGGAASSDNTRVYAILEKNGKVDKKLVLEGEYLVISKTIWSGPAAVIFCMDNGGTTNTFRNEFTLSVDDESSFSIRAYLQENCS
jgi:hypothetical protein